MLTNKQEIQKSVTDYLDSLVWDGTPRLDRWLVDYAGAQDNTYVRTVGRLILVAAVRRARKPGCAFGQLPILQGAPKSNSTDALRILAVNDAWFTDDLPLGSNTRRLMEATAGKWIVESSELERMKLSDVIDLKVCLSQQCDEARMAYDRNSTRVARQFVIIGTTSEIEEYLPATLSYRCFWPVHVQRFNLARLVADRDQLWAEAVVAEAHAPAELAFVYQDVKYPCALDVAPSDAEKRGWTNGYAVALAVTKINLDKAVPRNCAHSDKIWTHHDGSSTNFESSLARLSTDLSDHVLSIRCCDCGALLSFGPSNDAPAEVQIEIRAAKLSYTTTEGPFKPITLPEERIGMIANRDATDPPHAQDAYWSAGWLAFEIATHANREIRDADAWPWDHTRPLADQYAEQATAALVADLNAKGPAYAAINDAFDTMDEE